MPLHFRTSKSRLFVIVALFAVGSLVFLLWHPSQPSYEGRKLTDWLTDFPLAMDPAGNKFSPLSPQEQTSVDRASHAIGMMGESALSVLDLELHAKDSRLDFEVFRIFNRWHKYLRYEYDYTPAYVRQCRAISAVAELGTESSRFVPVLTRIYGEGSKNDVVRLHARLALQKMAPEVVTTNKLK